MTSRLWAVLQMNMGTTSDKLRWSHLLSHCSQLANSAISAFAHWACTVLHLHIALSGFALI